MWINRAAVYLVFLFPFVVHIVDSLSCESGSVLSYYIEANAVVEGKFIEKVETALLSECVEICTLNEQCSGANFLVSTDGTPMCLLVDSLKPGLQSETPTKEAVMYAVSSFCMKPPLLTSCEDRSWLYEKFSNLEIKNRTNNLLEIVDIPLTECLRKCTNRYDCSAVSYDNEYSTCLLLPFSVHTVYDMKKYFGKSLKSDVFERNCQLKESREFKNCTVLRLHETGYVDAFDARLDAVSDAATCERICFSWKKGACRSFTFDKKENRCYMSHSNPRLFGWQPMETINNRLSFGEVDNCMKFDLTCDAGSMTLHGSSMKAFEGSFKSKKGSEIMCDKEISPSHEFSFNLKYGECGMEKQLKPVYSYSGTVLVKEKSTDMITIRDKMIQINCRMHDEGSPLATQLLSFQLEVGEKNNSSSNILDEGRSNWILKPTKAKTRRPKYRLEVLSDDNAVANVVNVGKTGHLLITLKEEESATGTGEGSDFAISRLTAEDSTTKKKIILIDSTGCVVDNKMIQAISKPARNQLKIDLFFSGFSDQAQVVYHAVIKPCKTGCFPKCNQKYYIGMFSQ